MKLESTARASGLGMGGEGSKELGVCQDEVDKIGLELENSLLGEAPTELMDRLVEESGKTFLPPLRLGEVDGMGITGRVPD